MVGNLYFESIIEALYKKKYKLPTSECITYSHLISVPAGIIPAADTHSGSAYTVRSEESGTRNSSSYVSKSKL